MSADAEALVLTRGDRLPSTADIRGALQRAGLELEWQPFGQAEGSLNAYLVAPERPQARATVSISTQPLDEEERADLHARASARLGNERAAGIGDADVLVRISANAGPELSWTRAFETLLRAVGGVEGAGVADRGRRGVPRRRPGPRAVRGRRVRFEELAQCAAQLDKLLDTHGLQPGAISHLSVQLATAVRQEQEGWLVSIENGVQNQMRGFAVSPHNIVEPIRRDIDVVARDLFTRIHTEVKTGATPSQVFDARQMFEDALIAIRLKRWGWPRARSGPRGTRR